MKVVIITKDLKLVELALANGDEIFVSDFDMPQKIDAKQNTQAKVEKMLGLLGIPVHLLGYNYLRTIFEEALKDDNYLSKGITKYVYPQIAKKYGTKPSNIERNVRHAIEVSHNNANDIYARIFGNSLKRRGKASPTNNHFIKAVTLYMKEKIIY